MCVLCMSFVIQGLCLCLDFQFDTVVRDRPIILSKLLLLHFLKKDIPALSWEFFVNRFETLSLEAQLHLDCNKEFPFPTSKLQLCSLQKFPHLLTIVPQAFSITLGSLCVFFFSSRQPSRQYEPTWPTSVMQRCGRYDGPVLPGIGRRVCGPYVTV